MGIYRMLSDIGYVVGPAALGSVAELGGAQTALVGSAISAVLVVLPSRAWAPETVVRARQKIESRDKSTSSQLNVPFAGPPLTALL